MKRVVKRIRTETGRDDADWLMNDRAWCRLNRTAQNRTYTSSYEARTGQRHGARCQALPS